jgi:hypothetical protein
MNIRSRLPNESRTLWGECFSRGDQTRSAEAHGEPVTARAPAGPTRVAVSLLLASAFVSWPIAAAENTEVTEPATGAFVPPTNRATVIKVAHPLATSQFAPRPEAVRAMIEAGLAALTGITNRQAAWREFVSTQDVVGIKVVSQPGPNSGTRPAVVEAVIQDLLSLGIPASQIVVWDRHVADLRQAGFFSFAHKLGVKVAGSAEAGFDEDVFYDTPLLGQLVWGDHEFGRKIENAGRKSYASKLLTQRITKIISIAPLLNHNQAGVFGHLAGLATASVDNILRFQNQAARLAEAVPEIIALEKLELRDRTVLCITDALICQYQGEERQLLHYASVLNELWFSTDPVALDVLAIGELDRQRRSADVGFVKTNLDLYNNAGLLELGVPDPKRIDTVQQTLQPDSQETGLAPVKNPTPPRVN